MMRGTSAQTVRVFRKNLYQGGLRGPQRQGRAPRLLALGGGRAAADGTYPYFHARQRVGAARGDPAAGHFTVLGVAVVSFDFAGSGLSDGEYVTLGANERLDCRAVVTYLRAEGKTSTIAFWGRSMGAVTALLYADEDNMVDAMVLDSPFASSNYSRKSS